jgi:hypothetical protein
MPRLIAATALLSLVATAACTTLGPTPATTALSAVPQGRPGIEAQAGAVPGFFLSGGASNSRGGGTGQASGLIEPDRLLGIPGLVAGVRVFGADADSVTEPFLGYRSKVGGPDGDISVAGFVYGTEASATDKLANYHAKRAGAELAVDARFARPTRWLSLHLQTALTGTGISATGNYCVDAMGMGTDCDTSTPSNNKMVNGTLQGFYGSATASLAADFHPQHSWFHDARLAILGSAGEMPTLVNGEQRDGVPYASMGLMLSVGVGAAD